MAASGDFSQHNTVETPLGKRNLDVEGSPISGVRMNVSRAYAGIPELLQKVINRKLPKQILRQSGGPMRAGSITLRPHLTMGLPFRGCTCVY